jgi:hypothetical protein
MRFHNKTLRNKREKNRLYAIVIVKCNSSLANCPHVGWILLCSIMDQIQGLTYIYLLAAHRMLLTTAVLPQEMACKRSSTH